MPVDEGSLLDKFSDYVHRDFPVATEYVERATTTVAGHVNDGVESASVLLRETLSTAPWVPDMFRPPPPPPPAAVVVTMSSFERVQNWFSRHKFLTGVVIIGCGTFAYKGYRRRQSAKKIRRAHRSSQGGRTEVVVIAGSPALPLTKALALDMERRGFIVYIVCNAAEDENMVEALARPDIRALGIDTTNPPAAGAVIEKFATHLQSPHPPAPKVKANPLTLKSVILIPSLHYQTSPIATIPPSSFADLFNTHLLQPILTIQAFLPLLTSRLQPIGEKWVPPKVLVFTPSIISSINPPFHAPEATVCSALSAFTDVLAAELRPLDIPVTHMQMGTFDFPGFVPARALTHGGTPTAGNPQDTLSWPDGAKATYARNFIAQTSSAISGARIRGFKGSSLRHLNNTVFDVMDGSITSGSVRVGLGAGVYGFVGRWAPRGLVSWMMGIRKVDQLSSWKNTGSSYDDSSTEVSEDGEISSSHDFIPIPAAEKGDIWGAQEGDNIWASSPARRP